MTRRKLIILSVLVIILLSSGLRFYAASRLSVDYDEPVYLQAAITYANYLREGKYTQLAWDETTFEHPALYKIMFGVALLNQPPLSKLYDKDLIRLSPIETADARSYVLVGRRLSIVIATAAISILASINPLAGLFLGINTLSVNYTSEFYLEAFPLLTSLLSILAYSRWFMNAKSGTDIPWNSHLWLLASAVFLGMTAASKYVYCIVGVVIICHFLISYIRKQISRRFFLGLIAWGMLAVLMFFVFNPYLWPHPISRLIKTITFHLEYKDSDFVRSYHYPFWQPFLWLYSYLTIYGVRPFQAFLVNVDPLIFGLAVIGMPRLYKKNLLFFLWLVLGISMLLIWNTKWPQYTLAVLVPFAMAASEGLSGLLGLVKKFLMEKKITNFLR